MRRWWALVAAALVLASGCTSDEPGRVQAADVSLVRFDACEELLDHLKDEAGAIVGPWGLGGMGAGREDVATPLAADQSAARSAPSAPTAGTDYSTTNVQEAGVDEPDMVKTDGRTLYVVSGRSVHAVSVGDRALLGSLELDGHPSEMLLSGSRLVVFGSGSGPDIEDIAPMSMPWIGGGGTRIWVVDASDAASMSVVSTLDLDSGYRSARLVDGVARVVVVSYGPRIDFTFPQEQLDDMRPFDQTNFQLEQNRAAAENRRRVEASDVGDWLPSYTESGSDTAQPLAACEQTYRPAEFAGLGTVTVFTLDPATGTADPGASVIGGGEIVYSSARSLYVTTTEWRDEPVSITADDPVSSRLAVQGSTAIHAFDITDANATAYTASGSVPGRLLNQFSMSEHEDILRVAVTHGTGMQGSSSSVITLRRSDRALEQVGRVDGLGHDEDIHAVRFIGDLGYVVTFRRIDPLYVVDLSDPAAPTVRGELKIPGYSAYLHPVADDLLLGVGQEATEQGRAIGFQASLFDVSNPAEPKRLQQWILPGGHSEAEFDHHAFLWWEQESLALVPVTVYEASRQQMPFSGAVALQVSRDGVTERGRVSHPSDGGYLRGIRRSLVAADTLFTVSAEGVLASDLRSLEQRAWVRLPVDEASAMPLRGVAEPSIAR